MPKSDPSTSLALPSEVPSDDLVEPFHSRRSYLSLTTFRPDGSGVTTPVWCVAAGDRLLMRTDSESHKVKRLRRNPSVVIAPCDFRGGRRGTETEAVANELPASERKRIERLLLRKYPVGFAVEIAFLRPLHGGLAALGRGRKRGRPLFFEILVTRALLVLSALHLPEAIAV